MFQVAQPSVDEEWPELGKVVNQPEKESVKVPVKPRNKRNWKRLDDNIALSRPADVENNDPSSSNDTRSSSSRQNSGSGKSVDRHSPSGATHRPVENGDGNFKRMNGHSSDNSGYTCLFVRPDFAGAEIHVTIPRPGFSKSFV